MSGHGGRAMSGDGGTRAFHGRLATALKNDFARQAIEINTSRLARARQAAVAAYPGDFEALRARGHAIKEQVIRHLDRYLAEATARVEALGGHVHRCADGPAVAAVILEIARRRGTKLVAKSKSMVTEEIHLNQALEAAGLEVVETDVGEWIVQLGGEGPSHIIAPATHRTRAEIARLFSQVAGRPLSDDTPTLIEVCRRHLRRVFLEAGIGINGCNFLVAETGSAVVVTNEGNDRMLAAIPPVQVVVAGIERIVATWDDLEVALQLLARSATGQKLTGHTTITTGPRRPGELDGPEEFHLILLDNGRSAIVGTPQEEILHCIRCGACLNVCPFYRQVGGHAYGSPYSGPMGSILTPLLMGREQFGALADACSLCGACTEVCPSLIPLHDLIADLRQDEVAAGHRGRFEGLGMRFWALICSSPRLYRLSLRLARLLQRPFRHGQVLRGGPPPLAAWTRRRDFPAVAPRSFRERWQQGLAQEEVGRR